MDWEGLPCWSIERRIMNGSLMAIKIKGMFIRSVNIFSRNPDGFGNKGSISVMIFFQAEMPFVAES